jgi:hypothetical protein
MTWIDQGRQEHGWFGHGTSATRLDPADPATRGELRGRTFAAVEYAADAMGGTGGLAPFNVKATRDTLRDLVPVWAAGAHLPPNTFRQIFFGKDFDPIEAWGLQRTVLALMNAHTHAALKDTGPELAAAIQSVGLSAWPGVLKDAQGRATQLLSPAVRADFVPSGPALAGAASTRYPRLDGSGDRIRPVYPVEEAIAAAVAALTGGASNAARVLGGAAVRQVMPGSGAADGVQAPVEPPLPGAKATGDAAGRPSSGELPANGSQTPAKPSKPGTEGAKPEKTVDRSPSDEIDEAIRKALDSTDKGTQFEGETAKLIEDAGIDVIAFQKKFWLPPPTIDLIGEIDVEISQAIIESTIGHALEFKQMRKLINNKTINPDGNPVILYLKNGFNLKAAQEINKIGGIVVRTPGNSLNFFVR